MNLATFDRWWLRGATVVALLNGYVLTQCIYQADWDGACWRVGYVAICVTSARSAARSLRHQKV